jgi:hypothetical protein
MRWACGDVRDHVVSHKNDHGPSYRRSGALQRQRHLKINFREIFGVVRFSTFATVSALNGHRTMSDLSPLCAQERTSQKVKPCHRYTVLVLQIQVSRGKGVLPLHVNVFVPSCPIAIPADQHPQSLDGLAGPHGITGG